MGRFELARAPRPPWWRHPVTIGVVVMGLAYAGLRLSSWRAARAREAANAATGAARRANAAARAQVRSWLTSLAAQLDAAVDVALDAPCPADVRGPIAVVTEPWRRWFAAAAPAERPDGDWLLAGPFAALADPSTAVDAAALTRAPAFAILRVEQATTAAPTGAHSFRGGEVRGELRVHAASGACVCRTEIRSAPMLALVPTQRGADELGPLAVHSAARARYRTALEAALARLAPSAALAP